MPWFIMLSIFQDRVQKNANKQENFPGVWIETPTAVAQIKLGKEFITGTRDSAE